jgi:hypothetical protein
VKSRIFRSIDDVVRELESLDPKRVEIVRFTDCQVRGWVADQKKQQFDRMARYGKIIIIFGGTDASIFPGSTGESPKRQ